MAKRAVDRAWMAEPWRCAGRRCGVEPRPATPPSSGSARPRALFALLPALLGCLLRQPVVKVGPPQPAFHAVMMARTNGGGVVHAADRQGDVIARVVGERQGRPADSAVG